MLVFFSFSIHLGWRKLLLMNVITFLAVFCHDSFSVNFSWSITSKSIADKFAFVFLYFFSDLLIILVQFLAVLFSKAILRYLWDCLIHTGIYVCSWSYFKTTAWLPGGKINVRFGVGYQTWAKRHQKKVDFYFPNWDI